MGLEENKEVITKISDKKKREFLIAIIEFYLKTARSIMEYYKAVATTRKAKLVCTKSIKNADNAINHIRQIKHVEVLEYLYSCIIGNNVIAYSISGQLILSKQLQEYDTDEGVKELVEIMKKNKEKEFEQLKKREETLTAVRKAKEQGKKVEMVYDPTTKTTKPMIVEDGENN